MQKILLIQDMLTNMLLTPALTGCGFKTIETTSFKDAQAEINKTEENQFFVAIIDLGLSDTDTKVVEYMINKNIPIIIYSEIYDDVNLDELILTPIIDFVVKKNSEDIKYITKILTQINNYKALNVLLVEEDAGQRVQLEKFIKPLFFKNIFHASSGVEALEVIKKEQDISLVITIYNMEKMNGLELVQNIKKMYSDDKLAIVSITKDVDVGIYIQFLRLGVSSFLNKPYLKHHLNSVIHNEMENLFTKQKILKQTKDLGIFVRKIKSTNLDNHNKHKQKVIELQNEIKNLENEKNTITKKFDVITAANELMKGKINQQAQRLGTKKGEFIANEVKGTTK